MLNGVAYMAALLSFYKRDHYFNKTTGITDET